LVETGVDKKNIKIFLFMSYEMILTSRMQTHDVHNAIYVVEESIANTKSGNAPLMFQF